MAGLVATNARRLAAAFLLFGPALVPAQTAPEPPSLAGRWLLTLWPDSASTPNRTQGVTGSLSLEPARGTPRAYGGRYHIGLPAIGIGPADARVVAGAGPGDSVRLVLNPNGQPRPLLFGVWRLGAVQGRYLLNGRPATGRFALRRAPR